MNRAASVVTALVLASVPVRAEDPVARTGRIVMGTVLEVTVVAGDRPTAQRLANDAIAVASHWDDVLTIWREDGELARLNARAGDGPVPVSRDLAEALETMRKLFHETDGAFDPAVGPWVERWQESQADGSEPPVGTVSFDQALRRVGPLRYELGEDASLDPGGIGKGIALDAAARTLHEEGAKAAFLDFGGSSQLSFGHPPEESVRGWRMAVAGMNPDVLHGTVLLEDGALSSSRASDPRTDAGPIVNPASGRPVPGPRLATVLAPDATKAEAWSTALVVLGRKGLDQARHYGVEALFEDADGVTSTAGFPLDRSGGPGESPSGEES